MIHLSCLLIRLIRHTYECASLKWSLLFIFDAWFHKLCGACNLIFGYLLFLSFFTE